MTTETEEMWPCNLVVRDVYDSGPVPEAARGAALTVHWTRSLPFHWTSSLAFLFLSKIPVG